MFLELCGLTELCVENFANRIFHLRKCENKKKFCFRLVVAENHGTLEHINEIMDLHWNNYLEH